MLAYIQGNITHKSPTHVIVESGGLGYMVNVSLNTFAKIQQQSSCKLHTYLHIGGSLQGPMTLQLFGFFDEAEREIFLMLLSVSGVGVATVRMILSSSSAEEIQRAILSENVKLLESIKGIGPKTAKRIILELKDKIGRGMTLSSTTAAVGGNAREEAISALVMLGFTRLQADSAVNRVATSKDNWTAEELIKQSLKAM
jgi:Holliday junction DNA helicase RuvA